MATISDNALDLLKKRYFHKEYNEQSWEDICKRVSIAIADAEETQELKDKLQQEFYNLMIDMDFIPSTPVLLNADINNPGQLSSCFIIDIKDNIESIYQAKAECAKIFQKNGGVGFNISTLRPSESDVETSKGYAGGPIDFMEEFDLTADIVTRHNIRKGAMKIDLAVWHPDIQKFIHCKDNIDKLQHMNISVSITDEFMNSVLNDEEWMLKFPDFSWNKAIYNNEWNGNLAEWESKGYPVKKYAKLKAKELYREIMESAWKTGEPGISLVDIMDKYNKNPHLGRIAGSNPCAEFTNIPYSSCNLASINLSNCGSTKEEVYNKLSDLVPKAVRFLDNMITVNKLPLDKIQTITNMIRPIGLGTFGLAELLYVLKISYNSKEGYKFIDELYKFISDIAIKTSMELANERSVYPAWRNGIWFKKDIRIRNSNLLSIAPNGSIAFIAGGLSGGLEPVYALVMQRRTNEGDIYYQSNSILENELKQRGLYSEELLKTIYNNNGSLKGLKNIPDDLKKIFVTAYDITPKEHLKVLSIIQKHVDLSCSKTVNLSNQATVEDIMDLYIEAWKQEVKGLTIYRNGCRDNQVLSTGSTTASKNNQINDKYIKPKKRSKKTVGVTESFKVGCGKIYLTINNDKEGNLVETFSNLGATGVCSGYSEGLSRMISLAMRSGIDPYEIIDQLNVVKCPNCKGKSVDAKSCPNAFGKAIEARVKELHIDKQQKEGDQEVTQIQSNEFSLCPECGEKLINESGCVRCNCGYSRCG